MFKSYPALIHSEDGFWIEFPDLEGCQTFGENIDDTLYHAEEALGLYLASRLDNGQEIPEASPITDIECDEGCLAYVSVDVDKYRRDTRAVKKMISVPAWLAKEAEKNNLSLSKILQDALKAHLHTA